MHSLRFLYLRNFRNFAETQIEWNPKANLIYGDNGQGKTNLLEAIILLSTGRSFRTQHLSELIKEGEQNFCLEAELDERGISHVIKLQFDGKKKSLQINATSYSHFTPILGLLPSVLYAPQSAELVAGLPVLRRRFFDLYLAQSNPLYVHHLARFYRSMKQRNFLLRSQNLESIECWEQEMAGSAAYLYQERKQLIASLQPLLMEKGKTLSCETEIHEITFHSSYSPQSSEYLEQLKKYRKKDQDLKHTSLGPHRDDFSFSINGKAARLFASEGQKRTALAALKLAEWHHLSTSTQTPPLFAVDDFGQPLDEKRQERFCEILQTLQQVIITTPKDLSFVNALHPLRQFSIKLGTV